MKGKLKLKANNKKETKIDYNHYKLSELRDMFPDIKDNSKAGFIEQIEENV